MFDNGPRYDRSAQAAAEIVNLYLDSDRPKGEVFGSILFVILRTIYAVENDLGSDRFEPSKN